MHVRILIAERRKDLNQILTSRLKAEHYSVDSCKNGREVLEYMAGAEYDALVLDIMMPVMDGVTMLMKLREQNHEFPVIMLSAKSEEVDKIMGLNMGADDYVTKPYAVGAVGEGEFPSAQIFQISDGGQWGRTGKSHVYTIGGLELNEETVEVTVDGEAVKLTPMEFKIVQLLIKNPGRVFSADEIYERIWNEKAVNTDTIMVHVRNIREKIEIDPRNPKYLKWYGV